MKFTADKWGQPQLQAMLYPTRDLETVEDPMEPPPMLTSSCACLYDCQLQPWWPGTLLHPLLDLTV